MAAKRFRPLQQHTAKKNNGRDLSDASFTVILRLARFCFFNPHVPDSLGLFDMLTKFSAVTTTNLPPRSDESKQERGWGWRGGAIFLVLSFASRLNRSYISLLKSLTNNQF